MKFPSSFASLLLFALALATLSAAAYFSWAITGASAARRQAIGEREERVQKEAGALRTRALANDTEAGRAELARFAHADLLAAVDMIEGAGRAARVSMRLSGAQGEAQPPSASSLGVRPVSFTIDASGGFAALMRSVELLEALPIPSSVQALDVERAQGSESGAPWRMNMRLRMLLAADPSS